MLRDFLRTIAVLSAFQCVSWLRRGIIKDGFHLLSTGAGVMPRSDFDHFLLTRFNVRFDAKSRAPSDEWLRRRLDIMRQWALPAVRRQTASLDGWLVFCDAGSPAWFRDEMSALLRAPEVPVWVDGLFCTQTVTTALEKRMSNRQFLITTRVDNDDSISIDFIQLVQKYFRYQEREFINFTYGSQYGNGHLYFRADPSNAFISLIERRRERAPMSVFVDMHTVVQKYGPVRQVRTHPTWIQNVHGDNVANCIRGIPVDPDKVLRHFVLDIPIERQNSLSLLAHKIRMLTILTFRVFSSLNRIKWLLKVLLSGSGRGASL